MLIKFLDGTEKEFAVLSGANLKGANLKGANLKGANLSYAKLSYANLSGANLSGANLSGANLSYANLSYADLSGADLILADLSGATLEQAIIANCRGDGRTILSISMEPYNITIHGSRIAIGCVTKTLSGWKESLEEYDDFLKLKYAALVEALYNSYIRGV